MTKWILAAGAAALAITSPALADRKGGKGGGKGSTPARPPRPRQGAAANRADRAKRGRRGGKQPSSSSSATTAAAAARDAKADRGEDEARTASRRSRWRSGTAVRIDDQGKKRSRRDVERAHRDRSRYPSFDAGRPTTTASSAGLPANPAGYKTAALRASPRSNGCLPPGQAKKLVGTPLARGDTSEASLPAPYRDWYPDNDDYLYRVRRWLHLSHRPRRRADQRAVPAVRQSAIIITRSGSVTRWTITTTMCRTSISPIIPTMATICIAMATARSIRSTARTA